MAAWSPIGRFTHHAANVYKAALMSFNVYGFKLNAAKNIFINFAFYGHLSFWDFALGLR